MRQTLLTTIIAGTVLGALVLFGQGCGSDREQASPPTATSTTLVRPGAP